MALVLQRRVLTGTRQAGRDAGGPGRRRRGRRGRWPPVTQPATESRLLVPRDLRRVRVRLARATSATQW